MECAGDSKLHWPLSLFIQKALLKFEVVPFPNINFPFSTLSAGLEQKQAYELTGLTLLAVDFHGWNIIISFQNIRVARRCCPDYSGRDSM